MQQTQEGFVLNLTFADGGLRRATATPYVIGADYTPRQVTGARAADILGDIDGLDRLPS